MEKYIAQLIADLLAAQKNVPEKPNFGNTQEEFNAAMDALVHAPPKAPKKIYGVSYEELPAPKLLSDKHKEQIVNAMVDTFDAFGVAVHFKDKMPVSLKYEILREQFADSIPYMPGWNIDFCSGDCPECKVLDYCDIWQDIWTKETLEAERKKQPK